MKDHCARMQHNSFHLSEILFDMALMLGMDEPEDETFFHGVISNAIELSDMMEVVGCYCEHRAHLP